MSPDEAREIAIAALRNLDIVPEIYAEAAAVLEAQGGKRLLTCDLCGHEIMPGNVCVPCVLRIHGHAQANVEEKKAAFLEAAAREDQDRRAGA